MFIPKQAATASLHVVARVVMYNLLIEVGFVKESCSRRARPALISLFSHFIAAKNLASNALGSAELRGLYGLRGGNRVTLCMSPGTAGRGHDVCRGALWRRHWVLVRGSCVARRPLYPVVLVRDSADNVDCEEVQQGLLQPLSPPPTPPLA
ncbi:hypothetical protein RR46_09730 [Papilio xuthus]|uniref:Uncharacterized protein n=1 Tax=Papilio xuthus TaxID=66420 RepID=A0A194QAM7_PAPXU|nr:hypothetical protein RR46_09730 [Papilio xuthus]